MSSFSLSLPLFLSLSFRLILWSTEALWVHFPAWAFKILSRRCSAPSPLREGAWCFCEQPKTCVKDFIGFLRKPRNISLFHFLIVDSGPPGSGLLKDPKKWHSEQGHWYTWHFEQSDSRLPMRSVSTKARVKRLEIPIICLFYFTICLKLRDSWFRANE